ncbi:MAG TPA: hypothetical protein VGD84_09225 [Pseudonocardiaceae bacterium]
MSGDSVLADQGGLRSLVSVLRNGADELSTAATPAPDAPDAGRSSVNVGAALSAIAKSAALLIAQSQDSADKINTSSGAYGNADNQTATGLHGLG